MGVPTRREILEPMATDKEGAELKDLVLARLMVLLEESDWKGVPVDIRKSLKKSIRVFVAQYVKRYRAAGAIGAFLKNEESWLDSAVWLHTAAKFYFRSEDFNVSESEESEPSVAGDLEEEEEESDEEDPTLSKGIDPEVKVMDLQGDLNMYIEESKVPNDKYTSNRGRKRKPTVKDQSVSEYLAISQRKKSVYKEDSDSDNWEDMYYEPPPKKTRGSGRGRGRGRGRGKGRGRGRRAHCYYADQGFSPDRQRTLVEDNIAQIERTDLESYTSEELLFAASQSAIRDNRPELRQAVKLATRVAKDPLKARDLLKGSEEIIPYTEVEAVLLTVENNLPNRVYQELRLSAKSRYADIYPTYHHVGNAKISCYPEGIQVNNNVTEVPLQNLLNHTAERILQLKKEELSSINPIGIDRHKLILSVKWGYDGSSGSSEYRESDLFCTSLVPMYLKSGNDIIWKNPNPASIRFCRPLSLQLGKESPEMAYEAQIRVETQIRDLKPYSTCLKAGARKKKPLHWRQKKKKEEEAKRDPEKAAREEAEEKRREEEERNRIMCSADVFFHVQQTVLDPSIANSFTGSNASVDCHICSSKPNPFDQASLNAAALRPNIPVNPEAHKYTFSSMHAWVSVFECLIHLSCFLPQETWSAGTDVNMRVSQRKAEIHRSFRKELNLNIDRPRTGVNAGDAFVAKKAFESEADFARICGLDQGLIHRFHVILKTLSCEYEIDTEEFGLYCQTTCELFNAQYHWFHIPLIVHKILHHGASIISESILPIGMMSEEAHKARNKGYKPFFARHAKKEGKEHVMTDAMKFLMVTGDPVMSINSISARKTRQNWNTLGEVISLLKDSKGSEVKQEILDALEEEPLEDHPDITDQELISHREALDLSFDTAYSHPVVIQTDDTQFTIHNSQIATVYHHNSSIVTDPRAVVTDPRTVVTDPRAIVADARSIMADPRTVLTDPRAVVGDPRYHHHNPAEVTYDPNLTHIAFSIVPNISL